MEQHESYVALVVDPFTGNIQYRSSANLKEHRHDILDEAVPKLSHILQLGMTGVGGDPRDGREAVSEGKSSSQSQRVRQKMSSQRTSKKRKAFDDVEISDDCSQHELTARGGEDDAEDGPPKQIQYRADATHEWEKWFIDAFRAVQQVSCRVIAKEWIKTIHPKKQSTHPYNGKNPRTGEKGDSNSTKPPYWPKNVIHREPDHINKEARTTLLVHLLMNTPHQEMSVSGELRADKEITAEVLKESLEQKKLERQMGDLRKKFSIVEKIIEVRTSLEQYEYGGLSADTMISAPNYSDFSRPNRNDEDSDEADEVLELVEANGPLDDRAGDDWGLPSDTEDLQAQSMPSEGAGFGTMPKRDTDRRSRTVSPRTSTSGASHSQPALTSQATAHPHNVAHQQPPLLIHTPMITPAWEPYQPGHGIMSHEQQMYTGQHRMAQHPMHDQFVPVDWNSQMHVGVDGSGHFGDHQVMVSPASGSTGARMEAAYPPAVQATFAEGLPGPNFHGMHDLRHSQQLRCATPYEAFMTQPAPCSSEQIHRAYFG